MATYEVTAPLATGKDSAGKLHYWYTGAVLPDGIPADELTRLVGRGLIREIPPADLPASTDEDAGPDGTTAPARTTPTVDRPKKVAPHATWIDYAVARGMDRDQAAKMSKGELIDAFPE